MQGIHKTFLAGLVAGAVLGAGLRANAEPPTQASQTWEELDEAVVAHVRAQRFEEAYIAVKAALLIRENRLLHCNAGVVAWKLRKWANSAQHLAKCQVFPGPPQNNTEKEKRLGFSRMFEEARAHSGAVHIAAPSLAYVFIDGFKIGLAPIDGDIFVDADAEHEVKAELFGRTDIQRVKLRGGQREELTMFRYKPVKREPEKALNETKTPAFIAPPRPSKPVFEDARAHTWHSVQPILVRAGIGVSLLALAGGVALGSEAQKAKIRTQQAINDSALAWIQNNKTLADTKLEEANANNRSRVLYSVSASGLFLGSGILGAVGVGALVIDKLWFSKEMAGIGGSFK